MSDTRKATFKDVCCALQFGHERLFLTFRGGSSPIEYSLEPSQKIVDRRAAEKFLQSGHATPVDYPLLGGSPQSYGWRE